MRSEELAVLGHTAGLPCLNTTNSTNHRMLLSWLRHSARRGGLESCSTPGEYRGDLSYIVTAIIYPGDTKPHSHSALSDVAVSFS